MEKVCCKCKVASPLDNFGLLKSSKDGHRYDCKSCRKQYREDMKEHIKAKQSAYYEANKEKINSEHRDRWNKNKDRYNEQRKEYRRQPHVQEHIKMKNKEHLPTRKLKIKERRKNDCGFQLSEILRSKIHKMLSGRTTSYQSYVGCDISWLKNWLEYKFDSNMNWTNLGTYWQVDHVLPISKFDFKNDRDKFICFHWTNLQPLVAKENREKSDKILLHTYFNNLVSVVRFNDKYKQFLGYQNIRESLCWLREKTQVR